MGSVEVELNDGTNKTIHVLDSAKNTGGLGIQPGHWRVLRDFSPDAVVMVLASQDYDPSDYIHDYREFLAWAHRQ